MLPELNEPASREAPGGLDAGQPQAEVQRGLNRAWRSRTGCRARTYVGWRGSTSTSSPRRGTGRGAPRRAAAARSRLPEYIASTSESPPAEIAAPFLRHHSTAPEWLRPRPSDMQPLALLRVRARRGVARLERGDPLVDAAPVFSGKRREHLGRAGGRHDASGADGRRRHDRASRPAAGAGRSSRSACGCAAAASAATACGPGRAAAAPGTRGRSSARGRRTQLGQVDDDVARGTERRRERTPTTTAGRAVLVPRDPQDRRAVRRMRRSAEANTNRGLDTSRNERSDPPSGRRRRSLEALSNVIDPELGLDFVELGLVYDVEIDGGTVERHLHAHDAGLPDRPAGLRADAGVRRRGRGRRGGHPERWSSRPPWTPDKMSEDAKFALGY